MMLIYLTIKEVWFTLHHLQIAVGNHDYAGTAYNDHFNLPNVSNLGSSGQGNAQGDYYYIYNNCINACFKLK